jgi:folate-binding protein YgfZ
MVTDLWIIAAEGALLLDVPASLAAPLAARLDSLIFAEDVQPEDVSGEMPCVNLLGDRARVPAPSHGGADGGGVLVGDDQYGVPGLVAYGDLDALLKANGLEALGQAPEVNLESFEVLRIEAGVPRFLVDMTAETIPLEAGLEDRAISFSKGCYVGQEVIVRVTTRGGGRVARKLVGLTLGSVTAAAFHPPQASPLRSAPAAWAIRSGDRVIGQVTSEAYSPRLSSWIALGYVQRAFADPSTAVQVISPEGPLDALVTPLPFVPRA